MSVKLLMLNCRGLNSSVNSNGVSKIDYVKTKISEHVPDILILTETRLNMENSLKIKFNNYTTAVISPVNPDVNISTGIMVCHSNNVAVFEDTAVRSGIDGRYAIILVQKNSTKYLLAAVYGDARNEDMPSNIVFTDLFEQLRRMSFLHNTNQIILAGDFNCWLNKKDSSNLVMQKPECRKTLRAIIDFFNLSDMAELTGEYGHTYIRQGDAQITSRLDRVYVSKQVSAPRLSIEYTPKHVSDHATIVATFNGNLHFTAIPVRDYILRDKVFLSELYKMIGHTLIENSSNGNLMTVDERNELTSNYEKCPATYEQELCYLDEQCRVTHLTLFNIIMLKAKKLHDRHFKNSKKKQNAKLKTFHDQYQQLIKAIKNEKNVQIREDYQSELDDLNRKIKLDMEAKNLADSNRIKNFYLDKIGKVNSTTFAILKPQSKCRLIKQLEIDGHAQSDMALVAEHMSNSYISTATNIPTPMVSVSEFLNQYNVNLKSVPLAEIDQLESEIEQHEVQIAIQNLKTVSAPGPSGMTNNFFKLLWKILPNLFLKAVNEYLFLPGLAERNIFSWIKKRKVIFIGKPGKDPMQAKNFRPLSMLETFYKICSKVLADRLKSQFDNVLSPSQFGFRAGRSIQLPTLAALHAINDANSIGSCCQILSVDISAAFDSLMPQAIYETMSIMNFPRLLIDALQRLGTGGTGYVSVNGINSELFTVQTGTAQGCPASAAKYIIGAQPLNSVLASHMRHLLYVTRQGLTIEPQYYADDTLVCLASRSANDMQRFFQPIIEYAQVSGLAANQSKSRIICINSAPGFDQALTDLNIGSLVTEFKYLGVSIAGGEDMAQELTMEALNIKKTGKHIIAACRPTDSLHRATLAKIGLASIFNHSFMAFPFSEGMLGESWKGIQSFLWDRYVGEDIIHKRHLVAKNRVTMEHEVGGLELQHFTDIDIGLKINSLFRFKNFMNMSEDEQPHIVRVLSCALQLAARPTLNQHLKYCGSKIWSATADRLERSSKFLTACFRSMSKLLELLERHKDLWILSSIMGNCNEHDAFGIGLDVLPHLINNNMSNISQMLACNEFNNAINHKIPLTFTADTTFPVNMQTRMENLRKMCHRYSTNKIFPFENNAIELLTMNNRRKPSQIYRKLKLKLDSQSIGNVAPSYMTRIKDKIPVPDKNGFRLAFTNIFNLKLASKTREVSFNILNRTLWTLDKAHMAQIGDNNSNQCPRCLNGARDKTMHIMLDCPKYASIMWDFVERMITEMLRTHHKTTAFCSLSMNNIIFNKSLLCVPRKWRKYANILIQEIKREIYQKKVMYNGRVESDTRIMAHLMIILQKQISFNMYLHRGQRNGFFHLCVQVLTTMINRQ